MRSKILAIIPARGGSKRLANKNLKPLNNKPLISYTIDTALESSIFEKIILSSDSDEILSVVDCFENITKHKRADSLSGDKVKVIDLVLALAREKSSNSFDIIALLLPTCPFRSCDDLRSGLAMLTEDYESVVSLTEFEFPHAMATTLAEDKSLIPVFDPSSLITGNTRSQDHNPVYRPNGAFYMAWRERLFENGNFFAGKSRGYIMPRIRSVDIDNEIDFRYAEFLLNNGMINT